MERTRVKSSVIAALAYNSKTRVLEVEFHGGRVYDYLDVPKDIYRDLLAVESIGKYFNESVRPHYRGVLVRDEYGYVSRRLLEDE